MNKSSLMIYMGGLHTSSRLLARELGVKNFFCYGRSRFLHPYSTLLKSPFLSQKIMNHDLYLLEGLAAASLLPFIKSTYNKIIVKGNSQEPFFIENSRMRRLFFTKLVNLDKYVDHMIAVSKMIKEDFEKYFSFDIKIAEGFMYRDYHELTKLNPDFDIKNFIFVGVNPFLKGVDLMVDSFVRLKKRKIVEKNMKFYLVGGHRDYLRKKGYTEEKLKQYGIIPVGKTQNIEKYLEGSLFQFHLARYEPNAVAVMEGMASGHIPIISHKTGNKDFINKIDENLVIDSFDRESIVKSVERIVSYDKSSLRKLSGEFKRESHIYSTEEGLERWKGVWGKIIGP